MRDWTVAVAAQYTVNFKTQYNNLDMFTYLTMISKHSEYFHVSSQIN
jgi:hypothetical protein